MKRLLSIIGTMNTGGAETFLMKFYRSLDKTKYQIDFAIMAKDHNYYEDEIHRMGGKIYKIIPKSESLFENYRDVFRIVKNHKYKYVMRSGENAANVWELIAAKNAGAEKLIFNSTNSKTGNDTILERSIHFLFLPLARTIPNLKIGCSTNSVNFLFGRNSLKKGKSHVFNNGLLLDKYIFSKQAKERIRSELGISTSDILYGHIGRFSNQKNHLFLLNIFKKILEKQQNAKLLLVGDGPLKGQIVERVSKDRALRSSVIFGGVRSDIPDCLCAMDEFVFPSLYEGLPNALVEAQASGLPCIASSTITPEAKLTTNLFFEQLSSSPEVWANLCISKIGSRNANAIKELRQNGYDIKEVSKRLVKLIFND